jgi:DNA mismatch repair ATPase MutS
MHQGDEVFITKSGKFYHYFDDDCPTTSRILRGTTQARKVKEEEAKQMGYTLCKHCAKEYAEDLRERQGCSSAAILFLGVGAVATYLLNTVL